MKFYKDLKYKDIKYKKIIYTYYDYIVYAKLTAIYTCPFYVEFFKNGLRHNSKNASHIKDDYYKIFHLNSIFMGDSFKFTKQSWRKFVKLRAFL